MSMGVSGKTPVSSNSSSSLSWEKDTESPREVPGAPTEDAASLSSNGSFILSLTYPLRNFCRTASRNRWNSSNRLFLTKMLTLPAFFHCTSDIESCRTLISSPNSSLACSSTNQKANFFFAVGCKKKYSSTSHANSCSVAESSFEVGMPASSDDLPRTLLALAPRAAESRCLALISTSSVGTPSSSAMEAARRRNAAPLNVLYASRISSSTFFP
mmetsp:Transcript_11921/g.28120  ORF Transcript_11921/g.28120 Transcript_11921/m.28120 type:complete len:214 (+) Transcript_11921:1450-2091(+)